MSKTKNVTVLTAKGQQLPAITHKRAQAWLSQGRAVLAENDGQHMTIILQERVNVEVATAWERTLRAIVDEAEANGLAVILTRERILLLDDLEYALTEAAIDVGNDVDGMQAALDWMFGSQLGEGEE